MHEFELGLWKAVFTHLIHILYAVDPSGQLVAQLDGQYVDTVLSPMFSIYSNIIQLLAGTCGVIRRFSTNISEINRLAACDFKDLFQVSVFGSCLA